MLSAANENVLMAISGCVDARLLATPGAVKHLTKPPLETSEVGQILMLLEGDGLVRWLGDPELGYELTPRGVRETDNVIARVARNERPVAKPPMSVDRALELGEAALHEQKQRGYPTSRQDAAEAIRIISRLRRER